MEGLSDPVTIGVVVGAHGVRGTLRVRPLGSGKHLREGSEPVVAGIRRRISRARQTPKGFLLDLEDVGDRAEAHLLKGEEILLDRGELDPPDKDEFYVADLVGMTAVNDSGEIVGAVYETFETPAHEVLVVRETVGENIYVPFTVEHVPEVDSDAERIVVRPPEA